METLKAGQTLAPNGPPTATQEQSGALPDHALAPRQTLVVVAATLTACGGGITDHTAVAASMVIESAVFDSRVLIKTHALKLTAGSQTVDAKALLDWAQRQFPDVFPGNPDTASGLTNDISYVYRLYLQTGNYIAVTSDSKVYVLGPVTSQQLILVGVLSDFRCLVYPDSCGGSGSWIAPASLAEAARFLGQAGLGANKTQVSALMGTSYEAWIDAQMAVAPSQGHFDWLLAKGYGADTFINNAQGLDNTVWRKFISDPDALRQKMVFALSEICVVSVLGVNGQWRQFAVAHYLDILEANAFGNYRSLLEQLSLSPAMGVYLTYRGNAKASTTTGSQPDENYARELMQLFTIGLTALNVDGSPKLTDGRTTDSYQQEDVSGLARVFTGWDFDTTGFSPPMPPETRRRPLTQVVSRYETGAKTFLGTTIPAGTSATTGLGIAIDVLFNHPNLPPFISKQLIQRLVTSNPSAPYVGRVAAVFADNGSGVRGDLKAVVKAILLDSEARDPANTAKPGFGKLREPVIRFLNWARAFAASSASDKWTVGDLSDPATRLGQSPVRSGSVFNFFRPGYVPPNSALATQGLVGPEFQITTESSVAGYVNFMQRAVAGTGVGDLKADYTTLLAIAIDSAALLDELNLVLAANQLDSATLATLKTALDTISAATDAGKLNRVHAALVLVLASPAFIVQK